MKIIFWSAAALIFYTYAGYPVLLWLRSKLRRKPVRLAPATPSISVILIVRNEEMVLPAKLRNLASLDYPEERIEFVVVSDGSTDRTNEILREHASDQRLHVITHSESRGKAAGLNDAYQAASGEIVVFTDARQMLEPNAIRLLVQNFADAQIGSASGELMLGDPDRGEAETGVGLYWRIEKKIRELESASGSVVGATGAIYAVRRDLLKPLPPGTILDDVYTPMQVVKQGKRVVVDGRAHAWDTANQGSREFARKVRTLSGNYQLLQFAPWLLTPRNPLWFEFISHKLLRLVAPFALVLTLVSSALLTGPIYRFALVVQGLFYGLSLAALAGLERGPVARASSAAFTFVMLNIAAVVAFANFVTGRMVAWLR